MPSKYPCSVAELVVADAPTVRTDKIRRPSQFGRLLAYFTAKTQRMANVKDPWLIKRHCFAVGLRTEVLICLVIDRFLKKLNAAVTHQKMRTARMR